MYNLYENIYALCSEQNMTPGGLCGELGFRRSVLSDLKSGRKKSLDTTTLVKIADYFGVSVDYLLNGTKTEKAPTHEGERELPHAEYREVLAEGGMRLLMDADAKIPEEHVEEIVEFIKMKQKKYGR